ncbi:putative sterol 14alpha-demethylase [Microsporum audouinii]
MAFVLEYILQNQGLSAIILSLLLVSLVALLACLPRQLPFPDGAPKLLSEGYPVIGMLRFFSDRYNFYTDGIAASNTGSFSFYFGQHQIVGVSGPEGRKVFFQSKSMDLNEGYTALLSTTPSVKDTDRADWYSQARASMMARGNLDQNLPFLVGDAITTFKQASGSTVTEGFINPFDRANYAVYQSIMRVIGANEIADSKHLCTKTLDLFEQIEKGSSPARIICPWLPTPAYLRRMTASMKLYTIFSELVQERKSSGRESNDTLQYLIDSGKNMRDIIGFVLGTLYASQVNTPICVGWLLVYLASNSYWLRLVRNEIDSVLSKYRSCNETTEQTLGRLNLEAWESEFPTIDLCLRECIRLHVSGSAFRRNKSNMDVPIGNTGEAVPRDAYVFYLFDEVHLNPDIYPDPDSWDPGRYLTDASKDKEVPLSYLGWGNGRHPCLGIRLAKLDMTIIAVVFVSMFNFSLYDELSNPINDPPMPDRSHPSHRKPKTAVKLKYTHRRFSIL